MNKYLLTSTCIFGFLTLMVGSAGSASAGDGSTATSPYVGFGLGFSDTQNSDIDDGTDRKVKFGRDPIGSVFGGYKYDNGWRAEAELTRRSADVDSVAGTSASGDLQSTSLLVNVLRDFGMDSPFTPYVGLGAGISRVELGNVSPFGASSIDDTDWALATQGIAGVSYALNDNIDLFGDYRYFMLHNVGMKTQAGNSASFDSRSHSIMLGLRYNFGAPKPRMKPTPVAEPAPMPAPTPEPVVPDLPRNYIVFFDWDSAAITNEASNIIQAAAANANKMATVRLDLTGHADRSGTNRYNLALSQRRADAVKAAFVALGFNPAEIVVTAKGETDPLVPTDDGVREPQNRRVELVLP